MQKVIPADAVLIPDNAELKYKGVVFDTYQWSQELFDGSSTTFEMLRRPDTVTAICIHDDNIVVVAETQPHRGDIVGLPGGRVDPSDASTLDAAKREIREETGYEFKEWKLIEVRQPQRKIEWFVYLYVAWDVVRISEPHLDGGEHISVQLQTLAEVQERIRSGTMRAAESLKLINTASMPAQLTSLPAYQGIEVNV